MRHVPRPTWLVGALAAGVLLTGVGAAAVGTPAGPSAVQVAAPVPAPLDSVVTPPRASRARPLAAPLPVAPLRQVVVPDLLVRLDRPFTRDEVVALREIRGVKALAEVATGGLHLSGGAGSRTVQALGVDPSEFRAFTPRETASSDALWTAVARGDLATSYAAKLPLGRTVGVSGRSLRLGAVASFGLERSDVVVNAALARELGMPVTTVLISAPDRSITRLKAAVRDLVTGTDLEVLRPVPVVYRRPATYRELYMLSATYCPGLSWTVLSAIGQIESGHGRNLGPSSAGALGPMQFLPSTWAFAGVDGDGDGRADIMSAYDAVPAAALYLCRNGAGRGGTALYDAIFSYNHADWYVREVLDLAARYR